MNSIVNRSYYVALYIVKSIELLDNFDSKKYLGVISYLIKTRLIDSKFSKIIGHLQKTGESSDYDVMANFTLQDAQEMYEIAKEFVSEIEKNLNKN